VCACGAEMKVKPSSLPSILPPGLRRAVRTYLHTIQRKHKALALLVVSVLCIPGYVVVQSAEWEKAREDIMAHRHDLGKVMKGLCMVADAVIARNTNGMGEKMDRMKYHSTELFKVAVELATEFYDSKNHPGHNSEDSSSTQAHSSSRRKVDKIGFSAVEDSVEISETITSAQQQFQQRQANMKEQAIPATPLSRMVGFGGLAVKMAAGSATSKVGSLFTGKSSSISDYQAEILAETLCRMRGAALKLGQMLSLQDQDMLPPALSKALDRVKQAADYMPPHQLHSQLATQLGINWRDHFERFDEVPIAAASIGQVHKAVLKDGRVVVLKIQYPGVAASIESDLSNLRRLLSVANILPKGLFIDQIIKVAGSELKEECDYLLEAASQERYRLLVAADPILAAHTKVPAVIQSLTTHQILTSEFAPGLAIDTAATLPLPIRNAIARTALVSSFKEVFEWRFAQSDPNFANFLYDHPSRTIHFIDFGASRYCGNSIIVSVFADSIVYLCREYSKTFVDNYLQLVWAAANKDEITLMKLSETMGFLTGKECDEMKAAHLQAGFVIGTPLIFCAVQCILLVCSICPQVNPSCRMSHSTSVTPPLRIVSAMSAPCLCATD
jgi:aarF domain-containing kinase